MSYVIGKKYTEIEFSILNGNECYSISSFKVVWGAVVNNIVIATNDSLSVLQKEINSFGQYYAGVIYKIVKVSVFQNKSTRYCS